MTIYPDLPFDPAGGHGGRRTRTQMVVIHVTDNTASDESEAHYAEHRSDEVSAHFYNDGDSVIQALDTDVIAYGCFSEGNSRSVQFELVGLDWDHDPPGPGAASDATMRRVAPIVARVCRQYGIPIRKVSPTELQAGVAGICGHADVTLAWGQGDHMDPGPAFPWSRFLQYVEGGDMATIDDVAGKVAWIDPRVEGMAHLSQPTTGAEKGKDLPFVTAVKRIDAGIASLLAAPATLSDAQVQAIADRLVASGANGLTAADHAAVVEDVKAALRAGTA